MNLHSTMNCTVIISYGLTSWCGCALGPFGQKVGRPSVGSFLRLEDGVYTIVKCVWIVPHVLFPPVGEGKARKRGTYW